MSSGRRGAGVKGTTALRGDDPPYVPVYTDYIVWAEQNPIFSFHRFFRKLRRPRSPELLRQWKCCVDILGGGQELYGGASTVSCNGNLMLDVHRRGWRIILRTYVYLLRYRFPRQSSHFCRRALAMTGKVADAPSGIIRHTRVTKSIE